MITQGELTGISLTAALYTAFLKFSYLKTFKRSFQEERIDEMYCSLYCTPYIKLSWEVIVGTPLSEPVTYYNSNGTPENNFALERIGRTKQAITLLSSRNSESFIFPEHLLAKGIIKLVWQHELPIPISLFHNVNKMFVEIYLL